MHGFAAAVVSGINELLWCPDCNLFTARCLRLLHFISICEPQLIHLLPRTDVPG